MLGVIYVFSHFSFLLYRSAPVVKKSWAWVTSRMANDEVLFLRTFARMIVGWRHSDKLFHRNFAENYEERFRMKDVSELSVPRVFLSSNLLTHTPTGMVR